MVSLQLSRLPKVISATGLGRSAIFNHVAAGLLPKPIKIGIRATAWPQHEIDAIIRARIAGKTECEIRQLVADLMEQRKEVGAA